MMEAVKAEFVRYMFHLEVERAPEPEAQQPAELGYSYADDPIQGFAGAVDEDGAAVAVTAGPDPNGGDPVPVVEQRIASEWDRVGRNDQCPCGSGKKYKRCHGA
jgi:uncharacterized protein YecA (UPF0149 family)